MIEQDQERTDEQRAASRRVWIVVGILALLGACVVALVGAGALGLLVMRSNNVTQGEGWMDSSETRSERVFQVQGQAQLEVDSFAGRIEVVAGDEGQIRVIAVKRAVQRHNLERIEVAMIQEGNLVRVEVKRNGVLNNASVDITVEAPRDTVLDLHSNAGSLAVTGIAADQTLQTNAGSIDLKDCQGRVEAITSAGSIKAEGMVGQARLETNAGSVDYEGEPQGSCRFESSAGSVYLELPADLNAEIDLDSGAGSVTVDWPVKGTVERNHVRGTIGAGGEVEIKAHSGAGRIRLIRR